MEFLAIILYVVALVLCVGIFFFILCGSLFVGGVSGFFIGIFKGFKNYFSALVENLKLRK